MTFSFRSAVALLPLGLGLLLAAAAPALAAGPSFDCTAARLPAEVAICSDPTLARMDRIIARAYKAFVPEFADKTAIGRDLLADRNACGSDVACIASVGLNAMETYDAVADFATAYVTETMTRKAASHAATVVKDAEEAMPTRIGDCAATHIEERGTRFSETIDAEDNGEGSRVGLANGLSLVSYDHEEAVVQSRLDDPVVTCLISTPRDCPDGDDRGKGFLTLNLRTNSVWTFGDSQHMCGGA